MFSIAKRIGVGACVGLLIAGVADSSAFAQFNFGGQGVNLGGGLGGGAVNMPGAAGFNGPAQPAAAPANPLAGLPINPYNAVARMSSSTYASPPDPGMNPYGSYTLPDPYGGYLKGAADVIQRQGQYLINVQQAYLLAEENKRSKMATRRATYEEWLWERANTPTLEDERQRTAKESVRRAAFDPPPTEIWSGQALNILLTNLQQNKTAAGPNIPLDEDIIAKINLNSGKAGINFGLLKNEGKLSWPVGLKNLSPEKESKAMIDYMQSLTTKAFNEAKGGAVDANTIREMEGTADKLQKQLSRNVNDLGFAEYREARRFLNQLNDGFKALREPNAAEFANGKFKLKGNTVADLVDYMTKNGLQFAPAVGGEENAYTAVHRAIQAYTAALARQVNNPQ